MKLWMPRKSRWCWRENHWTTSYLSRYFRLLYHVYLKLCNGAQAFWRPCISFLCIPLIIKCEDDTEKFSFTHLYTFKFDKFLFLLNFLERRLLVSKQFESSSQLNSCLFSTSLSTTTHTCVICGKLLLYFILSESFLGS